jgi:DNA-binding protein YbaB
MTKKQRKKLQKEILSDVDRGAIKDARQRTSAHQTEQMRVAAVLAKQPEQMTADEQDVLRRACLVALTE